jgi:signal transduction histidine kinase
MEISPDVRPGGRGAPGTERSGAPRRSLAVQVARWRLGLPLAIVGIVLAFELALVPQLDPEVGRWVRLAFYSLLGPAATYLTLSWIVREVTARERAQARFAATYRELQDSHDLLATIQRVTERFAAADDLEAAVHAAASGIREATGAQASAVVLGVEHQELLGEEGMGDVLRARIRVRDSEVRRGRSPDPETVFRDGTRWILSEPVRQGDRIEGSVHAVFVAEPSPRAREAFRILAGEFASVAEAARGRMRDLLTLFDVDRSIRAEGNLERLLGLLLERTLERVEATRGAVFLADGGPLLQPIVVRPAEALAPLHAGADALASLAAEGRPQLLHPLSDDVRSEGGGLLRHCACAVVLPLVADDELLGLMVLGHQEAGAVRRAQLPFLSLLAGQIALALRNARAYLHSEELAIGEERARIAREIHDGVAQSLAFAALKIDLGKRLLDKDGGRARDELERAVETVREAIREVRRSIFALRPVDLERHGFVETIRRYASDFGQQNGVQVEMELGELDELDVRSEAVLFRIFQEAMHNVAKHAGARLVRVRVGRDERGRAFVEVADDGYGFDVDAVGDRVTSAGGLGLRQMRERVEARGGAFSLASSPGEGTVVRAALP